MGALTDNRKRCLVDSCPSAFSPPTPSKKLKIHSSGSKLPLHPLPPQLPPSSSVPQLPDVRLLPPVTSPLPRAVHGPQRIIRAFGIGVAPKPPSKTPLPHAEAKLAMGGFHSRLLGSKQFISSKLQSVLRGELQPEESSREELELEDYKRLVDVVQAATHCAVEKPGKTPFLKSFSPPPSDLTVATPVCEAEGKYLVFNRRVEDLGKVALDLTPAERKDSRLGTRKRPLYRDLYDESARKHDANLRTLEFDIKLTESKLSGYRTVRSLSEKKPEKKEIPELFAPLTDSDEAKVQSALYGGNRRELLVTHKASNIEITREVLQCLKNGAWLNDEVINLYLELMKEREKREPKRFQQCHFFNTFFYKKLTSGKSGYDFKAVRRWTTRTKLGYGLIECDKILVPIHKEVHWCLAVIDVKNEKFQYLDSLGGFDVEVLRALARYLIDEVQDKNGKQIDTASWVKEFFEDLPLQMNGSDCGMFMLKYADFYSRGLDLTFKQEHMPYFRKRTAKEILSLRAE